MTSGWIDFLKSAWIIVLILIVVMAFVVTLYVGRKLFGRKRDVRSQRRRSLRDIRRRISLHWRCWAMASAGKSSHR